MGCSLLFVSASDAFVSCTGSGLGKLSAVLGGDEVLATYLLTYGWIAGIQRT